VGGDGEGWYVDGGEVRGGGGAYGLSRMNHATPLPNRRSPSAHHLCLKCFPPPRPFPRGRFFSLRFSSGKLNLGRPFCSLRDESLTAPLHHDELSSQTQSPPPNLLRRRGSLPCYANLSGS